MAKVLPHVQAAPAGLEIVAARSNRPVQSGDGGPGVAPSIDVLADARADGTGDAVVCGVLDGREGGGEGEGGEEDEGEEAEEMHGEAVKSKYVWMGKRFRCDVGRREEFAEAQMLCMYTEKVSKVSKGSLR